MHGKNIQTIILFLVGTNALLLSWPVLTINVRTILKRRQKINVGTFQSNLVGVCLLKQILQRQNEDRASRCMLCGHKA